MHTVHYQDEECFLLNICISLIGKGEPRKYTQPHFLFPTHKILKSQSVIASSDLGILFPSSFLIRQNILGILIVSIFCRSGHQFYAKNWAIQFFFVIHHDFKINILGKIMMPERKNRTLHDTI